MTKNQITVVLKELGYTTGYEKLPLSEISYIFTDSDEAIYTDKYSFTFDMDKELLYVYEQIPRVSKLLSNIQFTIPSDEETPPSFVIDFELIIGFVSANKWRNPEAYKFGVR